MPVLTTSPARFARRHAASALRLAAIAPLAACSGGGDAPTGAGPAAIATLEVAPPVRALDAIGDTLRLAAVARDRAGHALPNATVAWRVLDSGAISIDQAGLVTACGNGVAHVEASAGEVADTVTISVAQVPTHFSLGTFDVTLTAIGEELELATVALDRTGHAVPGVVPVLTVRDTTVIAANGLRLVARRGGTTVGLLTAAGTARDSIRLTVQQLPRAVVIDVPTLTLDAIGAHAAAGYHLVDANRAEVPGAKAWTLTSSDPGVATVDATTGEITAVANGTAQVRIALGDSAGVVRVTVAQRVASVRAAADSMTFGALEERQPVVPARAFDALGTEVAGTTLTWSVVDCNGCVVAIANDSLTAKANGRALLDIRAPNSVRIQVPVVVRQRAASVAVSPRSLTIQEMGSGTLGASAQDATGHAIASPTVTWSTADESTATVDASGHVAGINAGTTTVTARVDGASGTATVIVKPAP